MFTLKKKIDDLTSELLNNNNELMVLASEQDDLELLQIVASSLVQAANDLSIAKEYINSRIESDIAKKAKEISIEDVDSIKALADEFDKSDNEFLQKQASVLDQVLLNLGVVRTSQEVAKEAQDAEVDRIRERRRAEDREDDYGKATEEHKEDMMASEAADAFKDTVKEYRPLETSLSMRYCPDHPGTQMSRIADDTYQCSLDKKIYNWKEGFTSMKGNKVPGGDVARQTQSLGDRSLEQMHFSTRENKLNE